MLIFDCVAVGRGSGAPNAHTIQGSAVCVCVCVCVCIKELTDITMVADKFQDL